MKKHAAVSVRRETYERLSAEAERRGAAVSTLLEDILSPVLGTKPPTEKQRRVSASRRRMRPKGALAGV